jgi:hypothetical protein
VRPYNQAMSEFVRQQLVTTPKILGPGERAFNRLRDLAKRIAIDLGGDESLLPAWILHLPSGEKFRIKTISHRVCSCSSLATRRTLRPATT